MNRLLIALLALSATSCVSRAEIRATIWDNNGMDPELCEVGTAPENRSELAKKLWQRGFFRKLDTGKLEFMPFCDPRSAHWLAAYDEDLNAILDKTLPKDPNDPSN